MSHVVKGRGPNRGKYLRWDWSGGGGRRAEWVAEQKRARRFDHGYEAERDARDAGGYAVRLTAPRAVLDRVEAIRALIAERSAGATEALDCHWVHGDDEAPNYCRPCCEKRVAKIRAADPEADVSVDGGWTTDHDSPPHCDACGAKLDGNLTDYGADEELEHFGDHPPETPDCWDALSVATLSLAHDDPRWRKVARIVDRATAEERKAS